ncbi:MAG: DUF1570 domain-containing protein [Planctomycetes bacterium]|nr:DUF1570 domain-containing protein [Planctomycetota bacterium]
MKHQLSILLSALLGAGCASAPSPTRAADKAPPEVHPGSVTDAGAAAPITKENWSEGGSNGMLVRTPHYQLRLSLRDQAFGERMPQFMECCFQTYGSALCPINFPETPLEMYIFSEKSAWENWTRKRLGRDAEMYIGLGKGGYTTDAVSVLYDIGRFDTQTIAAHEGWHQFSQRALQHPLPNWLEEGIACYMEGTRLSRDGGPSTFKPWRNFERWSELRRSLRAGQLIPLGDLLDGSPQDFLRDGKNSLLTYYAEVWALVQFLQDGEGGKYREKLSQVVQDAASGKLAGRLASSPAIVGKSGRERAIQLRSGNAVVLEYFNPDFATFRDEFDTFVKAITERSAGDKIARGEFPLKPAEPAAAGAVSGKVDVENKSR